MDIEAFYEQNEARRESAEFEFGSEWTDSADNEYELSWVEATGELYLMVEPDAVVTEDMFGDFLMSDEPVNDLTVVVIGKIPPWLAWKTCWKGGKKRCSKRTHSPGSTSACRRLKSPDTASRSRPPCTVV